MSLKKKAVFNWSGGKDSALALRKVIQENEYEVIALLTTISAENLKSSIHQIPVEILEKQAKSIGIPLKPVEISKNLKNYEQKMTEVVLDFKQQGVEHFIFGDVHLSEVKTYREKQLNPLGIQVIEPLWDKTSEDVVAEFLASGLKAKIIVTQVDKLEDSYIGKDLSQELVNSFPADIDVCGENGEYHSLVYDGDIFQEKVEFSIQKVSKISYDFTLDTGENITSYFWQAELE